MGSISNPASVTVTDFDLSTVIQSTDNRALTKFVKQAVAAQRSLQGMVCLGELGGTLRQIVHPAKALRESVSRYFSKAEKFARKVKKKRYLTVVGQSYDARRRRDMVKAITGCYLEAQFGWKPLISDIDSAAKAAARIITYRPPFQFVHGHARTDGLGTPEINQMAYGALSIKTVLQSGYNYESKLYGTVSLNNGWDGHFRDLGFTPADWLPTIWELIPYSFVVDYFTNIGDILEAVSLCGATFGWVNKGTLLNRFRNAISCEPVTPLTFSNPLFHRQVSSFTHGKLFSITRRDVNRSPYTGSLIPALEFTIPGLGTQWVNMGALVAQGRATSRRIAAL
jgi:hypothetical protein